MRAILDWRWAVQLLDIPFETRSLNDLRERIYREVCPSYLHDDLTRHHAAPSWYDTLPDDTDCSLEEWNEKVDALLDDVTELHRAIDTEE